MVGPSWYSVLVNLLGTAGDHRRTTGNQVFVFYVRDLDWGREFVSVMVIHVHKEKRKKEKNPFQS